MLRMRDVMRLYRTDSVETVALDGIDLDIADGEFVAIMGPSGCGKSTLLNVIGLLDSPTSGSYVFDGTEVAGLPEAKLAIVGTGADAGIRVSTDDLREVRVYVTVPPPALARLESVTTPFEIIVRDAASGHETTRTAHFQRPAAAGRRNP